MSLPRAAFALVLLPCVLAAQSTWIVDPLGTGNFTTLDAAHAAAAPGDTLILRGQMPGMSNYLTKTLHLVGENGALVYTPLLVSATGPLSVSGGTFDYLVFQGTTASLDGVTSTLKLESGATIAARACTFRNGSYLFKGAVLDPGTRAVFDGCSFKGRDAYAAFGVVLGDAALQVHGRAELRGCTVTGGLHFTSGTFAVPGGPAIDLAGSVDLRSCVLSSGLGQPLIGGSGIVQAENTVTLGATPSPGSVTIVPALLPWTTGASAVPGGVLQAGIDGPAATLAVLFAGLGMRPPTPLTIGDVWTDPAATVVLVIGVTDPAGALATTVPVPLSIQRGLQLTFQGLVVPGPIVATAPAILQVL
jgi:hypothetical protein